MNSYPLDFASLSETVVFPLPGGPLIAMIIGSYAPSSSGAVNSVITPSSFSRFRNVTYFSSRWTTCPNGSARSEYRRIQFGNTLIPGKYVVRDDGTAKNSLPWPASVVSTKNRSHVNTTTKKNVVYAMSFSGTSWTS